MTTVKDLPMALEFARKANDIFRKNMDYEKKQFKDCFEQYKGVCNTVTDLSRVRDVLIEQKEPIVVDFTNVITSSNSLARLFEIEFKEELDNYFKDNENVDK